MLNSLEIATNALSWSLRSPATVGKRTSGDVQCWTTREDRRETDRRDERAAAVLGVR